MTVLSLFDGISCGRIALERAGIKVDKYYASEIKKHAIKCSTKNWNDIIQIGDVTKVHYKDGVLKTEKGLFNIGKIDLLIGGSPCQNFSIARYSMYEREGLDGDKSKLFYEYLRLLNTIKPKYWLLENVKMKSEHKQQLNEFLGVEGLEFNSRLVSYQNRPRVYWSNIPFSYPEDRNINFQDFKETDPEECRKYMLHNTPSRIRMWNNGQGRTNQSSCKNITNETKINCITRKQDRCPNSGLIECDNFARFLSRKELEQGQTLPVGYTDCLTYNQVQDVTGDCWTVDAIVEYFKNLKEL